jgi:D-serine deaminase-like pyridoxal phosphate-dependent protein
VTYDLQTPALLIEQPSLRHNLDTMSAALPGARLRPHVKAHKCSSLAKRQHGNGHRGFTCATIREMEVMAAAGLGEDLLLANEVLDARRLGVLVDAGARVTVAVDSPETIAAARDGGVREVVVDVNVGLPRCGCAPESAGRLAELARSAGLAVRGVMGYEGHLMLIAHLDERRAKTEMAMKLLLIAAAEVGGDLISGGGTGTYAENSWVSEVQAGSYALMDTAYGELGLPFEQAVFVMGTVISLSPGWVVIDVGLKSLGMDHGLPAVHGAKVAFCSDEHSTLIPEPGTVYALGDQVKVLPAHVDPTLALHETAYLVEDGTVLESWPIDMRGW